MAQSRRLPAWSFWVTVLLLLSVFGASLCGCSETGDKLRFIVYGKQDIEFIEKKDGSSFSDILSKNSLETIPYIKLGDSITLNFGSKPKTEIQLEDIILNGDGTSKYS